MGFTGYSRPTASMRESNLFFYTTMLVYYYTSILYYYIRILAHRVLEAHRDHKRVELHAASVNDHRAWLESARI